jgi:hypothetical protein
LLKVLYTSGYSEDAMIHDGYPDAGVLLLAKPYRKTDLARMIRAALAAWRKRNSDRRIDVVRVSLRSGGSLIVAPTRPRPQSWCKRTSLLSAGLISR